MKVCHLTSAHPVMDPRILLKECRSLVQAGYDTYLVAPGEGDFDLDGVKVKRVNHYHQSRLARFTKTAWMVYQMGREIDADIYHFHDPELIPFGMLLRRAGKKVIYDAHEDLSKQTLSKEYIPQMARHMVAKSLYKLEQFAAKQFNAVVAATPSIENNFKNSNVRCINVSNYPLLSEFSKDIAWAEREDAVCYVGCIARVRGIEETVRAVGQTPYELWVAGPPVVKEVDNYLNRIPGWPQVKHKGHLDRLGVADLLSRCKVGTVLLHPVPNYLESMPIKLFEYWAAGIPVIASNFPFFKELVEKNNAGFCEDPFDSVAISRRVTWLMENPKEARQMGENGRKLVQERYNWGFAEKPLLNLYSELSH